MFRGSPYSHLMIPMPGFYDYGAGGTTSTAVAPRMVAEPKAKAAAYGVTYSRGWFRPSDIWAYNTWL